MPKVDLSLVPVKTGSSYPGNLSAQMDGRTQRAVGKAGGMTQFGANIVTLAAGALSSLRHWHEKQDEFLIVLSGELTLIDDTGETVLTQGDCAAFPAGDANGHHIVNKSGAEGSFFVVGTHTTTEVAHYCDVDMKVQVADGTFAFTRRDGTPVVDESE